MFSRYPVLWLFSVSTVGGVAAVALLFKNWRLAGIIYLTTALGIAALVRWFLRQDANRS